MALPLRETWQLFRLTSTSPKEYFSCSLGAVLERRRTAFTRASSSRMENGLVT
jgi:hypothetical protein